MVAWPDNEVENWNNPMAEFVHTEHTTDGTHDQTKTGYIDRGDPVSVDFDSFTTDNTWQELDLSGIIGNLRAKAVNLKVQIFDDLAGTFIQLRKNGNTNTGTTTTIRTQSASVVNDATIVVACDTSQKIEYRTTDTTITTLTITVTGWYL